MQNKKCYHCKEIKSKSEFNNDRSRSNGLASICRNCNSIKSRRQRIKYGDKLKLAQNEYYKKNRESILAYHARYRNKYPNRERERRLKRIYGINISEYNIILARQKGRCGICGSGLPGGGKKSFAIDHHHGNGSVRGLLCQKCNRGLGLFNDSIKLIMSAYKYLLRFEKLKPSLRRIET